MNMRIKSDDLAVSPLKKAVDVSVLGSSCVGAPQAIAINVQKYQEMIDNPDLSEEQKQQVIMALWSMIVMLVDLGFSLTDEPTN
ncbi:MAG: hypothetical protein ACU0A4_17175 [Paracoccaceae bacterium]